MMVEVKIPGAGESITEAAIGNWLIKDGDYVERDQEIAEVETDKATLPLIAPQAGKIKILIKQGDKVKIGDIACTIDTDVIAPETKPVVPAETHDEEKPPVKLTPLAREMMNKNNLDVDAIVSGLKKITQSDVKQVIDKESASPVQQKLEETFSGVSDSKNIRSVERTPMSPLRRKLGKRLVAVKNETAMLTTFNEVDMSNLMELRKKFQAQFQEKYGRKPGLVSFFAKACTLALSQYPKVNSFIEEEDILMPNYVDISIAVQTEKGLMAPVIRNTNTMTIAQIELAIADMAEKARNSKISIEEMSGGTFTITNGGVFGSMLSTPILNPPQSAILGMHNIVDRAVVINGKIEIRPVMYVALSYDHRVIDGRESVSFLYKVKELIESPVSMVINGKDPGKVLLGL